MTFQIYPIATWISCLQHWKIMFAKCMDLKKLMISMSLTQQLSRMHMVGMIMNMHST
jgi:hypothetical protein